MTETANTISADWTKFLGAGLLVMIRLSGLMMFVPFFSSSAIAPRIKAGFLFALTILLVPAVAALPSARADLNITAVLGELGVGVVFGLSLMLLQYQLCKSAWPE